VIPTQQFSVTSFFFSTFGTCPSDHSEVMYLRRALLMILAGREACQLSINYEPWVVGACIPYIKNKFFYFVRGNLASLLTVTLLYKSNTLSPNFYTACLLKMLILVLGFCSVAVVYVGNASEDGSTRFL
jgi:hypothetical protein